MNRPPTKVIQVSTAPSKGVGRFQAENPMQIPSPLLFLVAPSRALASEEREAVKFFVTKIRRAQTFSESK